MILLRGQNIKLEQTLPVRSSSHLQTHVPMGNTEVRLAWIEASAHSRISMTQDTLWSQKP